MKKILALLLTAIMVVSVTACGSSAASETTEAPAAETTDSQETTEPQETAEPADTATEASGDAAAAGWEERDISEYCKTTFSKKWSDDYGVTTYGDPINLADGGYTLGVSLSMTTDYFQTVAQAFTDMAERDGNTVITVSAERDASKQISDIEDLITSGCSAICLCAYDMNAIKPALVAIQEAGIYCIAFDSAPADTEYCQGFAGTDNYAAGYEGGVQMMKDYPDGGKIAVLNFPGATAGVLREEGFLAAIEGSNLEVVVTLDSEGDQEKGLQCTNDILEAHDDLVAIWGLNDQAIMGAYAACTTANRDIGLYGVDGTPESKGYVFEDGIFKMTAGQSPNTIGAAMYSLVDAIVAQANDGYNFIDVSVIVMTPDTVEPYLGDEWA